MTTYSCVSRSKCNRKSRFHFSLVSSYKLKASYGFSLIEVVIGVALITLSLVGLAGAYSFYLKTGLGSAEALQGSFLLQEGVEAVTLMRDDAWNNLSSLSPGAWYALVWNGQKWVSTTSAPLIDGVFTRSFKLDEVYRRNTDKDIVDVSSSDLKAIDANTKKLTVRVVWGAASSTTDRQMATYLANLFE